jgi:hypothetical protein
MSMPWRKPAIGRVEQIVRERIAVFAGRQAMAQPNTGDAVRSGPQQPEHGAGRIDAGKIPSSMQC